MKKNWKKGKFYYINPNCQREIHTVAANLAPGDLDFKSSLILRTINRYEIPIRSPILVVTEADVA